MKKKIIIFIILCLIFAADASAGLLLEETETPEQSQIETETADGIPGEENEEDTAAQNFYNTAVILLVIIGFMSVFMTITKINRRNLGKM